MSNRIEERRASNFVVPSDTPRIFGSTKKGVASGCMRAVVVFTVVRSAPPMRTRTPAKRAVIGGMTGGAAAISRDCGECRRRSSGSTGSSTGSPAVVPAASVVLPDGGPAGAADGWAPVEVPTAAGAGATDAAATP
ncbi:MAG: hypothetical protein ACKOCT_19100, partial [Alphaproteobacteria bacterium]